MKKLFFFSFLFFHICCFYTNSSIFVSDIKIDNFPNVEIDFFAINKSGKVISNFQTSDFVIFDNGANVPVFDVDCSPSDTNYHLSLVILFDLSIAEEYLGSKNFSLAKNFTKVLIDSIDYNKTELALCSFDNRVYLNHDFTTEREKLIKAWGFLRNSNGSNIDEGFYGDYAGAFNILSEAKYNNKAILLITDGVRQINSEYIINYCKENKVKVFTLSFSYENDPLLEKVCNLTNGKYFKAPHTIDSLYNFAKVLNAFLNEYIPCRLLIKGEINCEDEHLITITIPSQNLNGTIHYLLPEKFKPRLEAYPPYIGFTSVLPGNTRSQDVKLYARNGDIVIKKFTFYDSRFSILAGDVPIGQEIVVRNNDFHTITIQYKPTDSAIVFSPLLIESNACYGNKYYITGGFPNTPPKERTVKLLSPKANDKLIIHDTFNVRWEGLLPSDVIQLEYSVDAGNKWDTLATDVIGLSHNWVVPDLPTDSALVRAIQLWPNNIGETKNFYHKDRVNSALFNRKDGIFIITSCNDNTAKVWNSNSGILIHNLVGHSQPVLWADFDPAERYIISASADSTVKLWDYNVGSLIYTLIGHNNVVTSANFHPKEDKAISSSWDGNAIIWDVKFLKPLDTIKCNQGRLRFATFSPTGDEILTAGSNGTLKLWKYSDKSLIRTFRSGSSSEVFTHASFSPEGDKVVGASQFGRAFVWNKETGDTLYSITHNDSLTGINPVFTAYFHRIATTLYFKHKRVERNSLLLITASIDGAKLWDGETGAHIVNFVEHTNAVVCAMFNFDGSRVLTASWDSTAKVWNLEKRGLQIDTSGFFSITRAKALAQDVDFGYIKYGNCKDTIISDFIKNESDFDITIKDISIEGKDADCFQIISGFTPFNIDSLGSKAIWLSYKPKSIGPHNALLKIKIKGEELVYNLKGTSGKSPLEVLLKCYDFGKVDLEDYKDSIFILGLKNVSDKPIEITSINNYGPDTIHFKLLNPKGNLVIYPNEVKEVALRFIPEYMGRKNGQLYIYYNDLLSPETLYTFGEGVLPQVDTIDIYVESFSAEPGDIYEMKITSPNANRIKNKSLKDLQADLIFNSTLLAPLDYDGNNIYDGDLRRIFIDLKLEDTLIGKIKFKVCLGNDTTSILKIENVSTKENAKVIIRENSGRFYLKGICKEGDLRLFEPKGKLYLGQSYPNPAKNSININFELIESGFTQLILYNLQGIVVKNVFSEILPAGAYNVEINLNDLPTGSYFYVLKTPNNTLFKNLIKE